MLSNEETRDQRVVWGTALVSGRKSVRVTKIVWVTPTAVAGVHDQLRRFVPQTTWSPEKVVWGSRLA